MLKEEVPFQKIKIVEGIDLITEGILTLSRVESLLSGDGGEGQRRGGPADQILQML